ncbi:hypothetical protein glysoja_033803 [Glycine soja]|uniref:Uncharacterized protein n=1 Tax=Glycine soja TaxID=3848 RepID=A0A0B2Q8X2_GLYSO|nr:hypothetical protein glysoja_033803 [Glycine soja]
MSKDKVSGDPRRAVCTGITIFLLLAGVTLLVLWLVYRPHKPRFTVIGAGRRLRPKHHHPTADVDHRAVLRPHKEPEQACLHLLRQVLRLCLVQEPGHNAAGSAATPVPGEAQLGFGVPGDRRHAAPGVGGGFERVGDGRGLWGGGSEADI